MTKAQAEKLRAAMQNSLGQKLLRLARLFNERAIHEIQRDGHPLREAHTRLIPHFDFEGTRLTDLAARANITKQSTQQMVDELVEAGYLRRRPDPEDGRAKLIVLTRKGRSGVTAGLSAFRTVEAKITESMSRAQVSDLEKALDLMLEVVDENEDE